MARIWKNCVKLLLLVSLQNCCKNATPPVFPTLPNPEACTITTDPPKLDASPGDIAGPGQMGCPLFFEACLSQKAAAWLVAYQQWVDEQVAKCRAKKS